MGTVKCSSFTGIKHHLAGLGAGVEGKFIASLPHDLAEHYRKIMPVSRLPIEIAIALDLAIAQFLFPQDNEARQLHALGILMAQLDLNGFYKILLKVTTVPYAIEQSAVLWKTYHDEGQTRVEEPGKKNLRYIISNYPNIPGNYLTFLGGYIQGVMELCGAKTISVDLQPVANHEHVYDVRWT